MFIRKYIALWEEIVLVIKVWPPGALELDVHNLMSHWLKLISVKISATFFRHQALKG